MTGQKLMKKPKIVMENKAFVVSYLQQAKIKIQIDLLKLETNLLDGLLKMRILMLKENKQV